MLYFGIFFFILEFHYIANFALKHHGADLLYQRMFQEFVT